MLKLCGIFLELGSYHAFRRRERMEGPFGRCLPENPKGLLVEKSGDWALAGIFRIVDK